MTAHPFLPYQRDSEGAELILFKDNISNYCANTNQMCDGKTLLRGGGEECYSPSGDLSVGKRYYSDKTNFLIKLQT